MTHCRNATPGTVSPVPDEHTRRLPAKQLKIALRPGGDPIAAGQRLTGCADDRQPDVPRKPARARQIFQQPSSPPSDPVRC
jgi:hypothetical protein